MLHQNGGGLHEALILRGNDDCMCIYTFKIIYFPTDGNLTRQSNEPPISEPSLTFGTSLPPPPRCLTCASDLLVALAASPPSLLRGAAIASSAPSDVFDPTPLFTSFRSFLSAALNSSKDSCPPGVLTRVFHPLVSSIGAIRSTYTVSARNITNTKSHTKSTGVAFFRSCKRSSVEKAFRARRMK